MEMFNDKENEIKNKRVFDETIELKEKSILRRRFELFYEWDFKKNDALGLDIYKVSYGNDKTAWWNCSVCGSEYDMVINRRAGTLKRKGRNCPYCSGKRTNHTNSLASLNPKLASEWHPILNGILTPHDVTCSNTTKAWWIGECGHEWDAVVYSRTGETKNGCPYCSGHRLLVGLNDMWTTNPELAKLLADPNDGYRYMQKSHVKVDWKCLECENIIKNKSIFNINTRKFICVCSDDISFGEKFVYYLLKECKIEFQFDEIQKWSKRKRYDFFFEFKGKEYIVEVHGLQHYKESFKYKSDDARNLKEEQENDSLKEKLAKENGIDNYIIVDARESTVEWMKQSVLDSDLMKIIDCTAIDFENIGKLSSKSLIKIVCDLWNSKTHTMAQLAEKVNVSNATTISYLKRGAEIGWCDYVSGNKKPVVQLSKNLDLIRVWGSGTEAGESLGFDGKLISGVCNGKSKTTNGFRWMFIDDYEKYLTGCIKMPALVSKHAIEVVQLNAKNLSLIEVFPSQLEATITAGLSEKSSAISKVCQGKYKHKTAGGFKWMLKVDYDKMLKERISYEEYMNKYYPRKTS